MARTLYDKEENNEVENKRENKDKGGEKGEREEREKREGGGESMADTFFL